MIKNYSRLFILGLGLFHPQVSQPWFSLMGKTQLMKAAQKADIRAMKRLITFNDINEVAFCDFPHAGVTALKYAIDSGSVEAVQLLLDAGANPNKLIESPFIVCHDIKSKEKAANSRNLSPLSHAVNVGAPINIIKTLIEKGAHIDGSLAHDTFNIDGSLAHDTFNDAVIKNLKKSISSVNRSNWNSCSDPIKKIVNEISTLRPSSGEKWKWSDVTPLMIAAYHGSVEAVKILLEAGADKNYVHADAHKTALDFAIQQNHTEVINLLKKFPVKE